MDVATWYAVALGGLITAFFLAYMLLSVLAIAQLFGKRIFQKYLSYRQIPRYLRGPGKTTWFHLLLLLTFLITNVIALSVGVDDVPEFARRSGLLSVVNLIPLFLGGQINAISSHCGIGLKTYTRIHRWLGRVAIVEGLIHVIVTISIRRPNFETRADVAALVVSSL